MTFYPVKEPSFKGASIYHFTAIFLRFRPASSLALGRIRHRLLTSFFTTESRKHVSLASDKKSMWLIQMAHRLKKKAKWDLVGCVLVCVCARACDRTTIAEQKPETLCQKASHWSMITSGRLSSHVGLEGVLPWKMPQVIPVYEEEQMIRRMVQKKKANVSTDERADESKK